MKSDINWRLVAISIIYLLLMPELFVFFLVNSNSTEHANAFNLLILQMTFFTFFFGFHSHSLEKPFKSSSWEQGSPALPFPTTAASCGAARCWLFWWIVNSPCQRRLGAHSVWRTVVVNVSLLSGVSDIAASPHGRHFLTHQKSKKKFFLDTSFFTVQEMVFPYSGFLLSGRIQNIEYRGTANLASLILTWRFFLKYLLYLSIRTCEVDNEHPMSIRTCNVRASNVGTNMYCCHHHIMFKPDMWCQYEHPMSIRTCKVPFYIFWFI